MSLRAVIFDWDGTLIDSEKAVFSVYKELFKEVFGLALRHSRFRQVYTPDYRLLLSRLGAGAESDRAKFNELFEKRIAHVPVSLVTGMREVILGLRRRDVLCCILTGAARRTIDSQMRRLSVGELFDKVVSSSDVSEQKPAGEGMVRVLEEIGVGRKNALAVGDTEEDMSAARVSGVEFVGVLWGYHDRERLLAGGARVVSAEPKELESILMRWLESDARQ